MAFTLLQVRSGSLHLLTRDRITLIISVNYAFSFNNLLDDFAQTQLNARLKNPDKTAPG